MSIFKSISKIAEKVIGKTGKVIKVLDAAESLASVIKLEGTLSKILKYQDKIRNFEAFWSTVGAATMNGFAPSRQPDQLTQELVEIMNVFKSTPVNSSQPVSNIAQALRKSMVNAATGKQTQRNWFEYEHDYPTYDNTWDYSPQNMPVGQAGSTLDPSVLEKGFNPMGFLGKIGDIWNGLPDDVKTIITGALEGAMEGDERDPGDNDGVKNYFYLDEQGRTNQVIVGERAKDRRGGETRPARNVVLEDMPRGFLNYPKPWEGRSKYG